MDVETCPCEINLPWATKGSTAPSIELVGTGLRLQQDEYQRVIKKQQDSEPSPPMRKYRTFAGIYQLKEVLGGGRHGKVWNTHDKSGNRLAIKLFHDNDGCISDWRTEAKMYAALWKQSPSLSGFARLHNTLSDKGTREIGMVFDYVGDNLDILFKRCGSRWSISTVARIWLMLIDRIEAIHQCGYVLVTTRGANMCMGGDKRDTLYVIDLAGAIRYRNGQGIHRPCQSKCSPSGNSAYRSKNNQNGFTPSRRDDMESMAYAMLDFIDDGYMEYCRSKQSMQAEELACGHQPIREYLEYVEKLQYEQEPDYALLRQTIGKLLSTCSGGEEHLAKFEWQKDD